jgi:hypothetical protein
MVPARSGVCRETDGSGGQYECNDFAHILPFSAVAKPTFIVQEYIQTQVSPRTISSFLGVAALAFGLSLGSAQPQDMQGFDPKAEPIPDFKLTPFYEADLDFAQKVPGEILKTEPISAPDGAVAWRVMYVSRAWDDRLVPTTGIIVAPKGTSSAPRPILNWLHGTTGGARVAAPSLADNPAQNLV